MDTKADAGALARQEQLRKENMGRQEQDLQSLVGLKIVSAKIVDDAGLDMYDTPTLLMDDGTIVTVWCDPEGNGPGHLDVVPGGVVALEQILNT